MTDSFFGSQYFGTIWMCELKYAQKLCLRKWDGCDSQRNGRISGHGPDIIAVPSTNWKEESRVVGASYFSSLLSGLKKEGSITSSKGADTRSSTPPGVRYAGGLSVTLRVGSGMGLSCGAARCSLCTAKWGARREMELRIRSLSQRC